MSFNIPVNRTTRQVDEGFLPYQATRLVITQYLEAISDPPIWAWIIVGAFYDRNGECLWSTEVFAGHLNIELESDSEEEYFPDAEQQDWESSSG